ncbi:MAG: secretin N-terminal domain-containing protein, partial [bacterium]
MNTLFNAIHSKRSSCLILVGLVVLITFSLSVEAQETEETFSRAVNHYIQGEDSQASQLLEDVLARNPDHSEARELYSELGGGSDLQAESSASASQQSNPNLSGPDSQRTASVDRSSPNSNSQLDFQVFSPDTGGNVEQKRAMAGEQTLAEVTVQETEALQAEDDLPEFNPLNPEEKKEKEMVEEPEDPGEIKNSKEFANENYSSPSARTDAVYGLQAEEYEDRVRFRIKASGTIDYITSHIYDPPMLIIDIPGAINELPESPLDISMGNTIRVRHSQYRIDPFYTTRVVIDIEEWSDNYQVTRKAPGNEIVIDVFDSDVSSEKIETDADTGQEMQEQESIPGFERLAGKKQNIDLQAEAPEPLSILLTDSEGQPRSGQEVLFEVIEGGGRVDAQPERDGYQRATRTNEEGKATARFHAGRKAGLNLVEAYVPENDMTLTFQIRVNPGEPAQIEKISGDRQEVTFGSEIPEPLVLEVQDTYGNPVPETRVRVEDLTGEGLLDLDREAREIRNNGRTDENGRLEIDFYRISPTAKENRVQATVPRPGKSDLTDTFTIIGRPQLISISFSEAPLLDVVRTLAEIAGWNIAFPDMVEGEKLEDMMVSVHLKEVTALRALDTILDIKNLTRVADGNIMKIVAKPGAARQGVPVLEPAELADYPGNNMVTVTYNLSYLEASSDLAGRLQNALLAEESTLVADESSNALVVTDLVNNQRRLWQILQQIDQPDQLFEVRIFDLEYRKAEQMASNIKSLLPTGQGNVVANRPRNSLLVFADPGLMNRIEKLVDGMDKEGALPGRIEVVTLEGYDVDNIAQQVNAVLGLQPVPLNEILDFDVDIEDADELQEMIEAGRQVNVGSLLESASIIPLEEVDRILLFGPKDLRVMARKIIDQVKRDAAEYVQRKSWRWVSFKNL